MKRSPKTPDPWASGTWEGARREQLYRWGLLTLREKMQAVEDMGVLARHFANSRRRRGLPYRDPATGELVPGRSKKKRSTAASLRN
jgi:hypothetical protein